MDKPKTLQQAIRYFSNEQVCIDAVAAIRWPEGPVCHWCGEMGNTAYLANQKRWKCRGCRKQFSVKVGTIFEDSPIALDKWLIALWMLVNCKNGISSYEVGRDLGITQKSAWFVLQRLRLALQNGSIVKLGGPGNEVEVDETFIGGKARNMHLGSAQRKRLSHAGVTGKTVVIGLLDRGKEVRATVAEGRRRKHVHGEIKKHVAEGTSVYTDNLMSYDQMPEEYEHKVVDHAVRYVDGKVHTNGLENFWSLLKRGLKGTYISVEPFHLFRYVDEQAWRYNNRGSKERPMKDADRFNLALSTIAGKRLTFAEVTGKVGSSETLQ